MANNSIFLNINKEDYIIETKSFFVIRDRFPVSMGHSLIISKDPFKDYFELDKSKKQELIEVIDLCKNEIDRKFKPSGYNIGMNCGQAAGQTVFHFHCHIIPRYNGDMENPRGGVRHCIKGKGYYD